MYIDENFSGFDLVPANDPSEAEEAPNSEGLEAGLLPLLTTEDVAELLNVTPTSLDRGRCNHPENYPPFIKIGRSVRYRLFDILDWIELNLQGGII